MSMRMKPCPDRQELKELLAKAATAYDAMSIEERKAMHRAQRRSWVIGTIQIARPEMTREEVERIYDEISY